MRLEDEVYNQGNPNSSLYSRYWDIGVSGVGGNLFLTTEQLGNNIFNISNQGKITAYDFRYRDNNGNGEEFFSSAHFGNLSYLQLKKDWTFLSFSDSDPNELHPNGVWAIEYEPNAEGLNFWKPWPNETGTGNYFLFLANDGNIGMGTNCTPYKLNVDGVVGAREVIVEIDDWCDYVFEDEYELMTLPEVKAFIEANGHLPNIDPAILIETEGLNLGEIQRLQMEKISAPVHSNPNELGFTNSLQNYGSVSPGNFNNRLRLRNMRPGLLGLKEYKIKYYSPYDLVNSIKEETRFGSQHTLDFPDMDTLDIILFEVFPMGENFKSMPTDTTDSDDIITRASKKEDEDEVKVYPNPNDGNFFVLIENTEKVKRIQIIDNLGKQIDTRTVLRNENQYSNTNFNSGVYFIEVVFEDKIVRKKIIVN
jgi:hypothetical protein